MRNVALSFAFLLCSANASAITISTSVLPGELQACFQSGTCVAAITPRGIWASDFESTGAAAFAYQEWDGSSYDAKWLIRYDLLSPPGTVAGTAWLSARNHYDVAGSDAHSIILYFDDPGSDYFPAPPLTLTLDDSGLAEGSAFRTEVAAWIETEPEVLEFGSIVSGNLSGIEPLLCLAEGCGSSINFNLLHMDFAAGTFNFDPNDSRGPLFTMHSWYDCGSEDCGGGSNTQSLYVHAVPLPAAMPLLIGGLALLGAHARRRRTDTR